MFSVIFEVFPQKDQFDHYLDLAKELKPLLQEVEGFVDNERFESKLRPGWILSHSTWRDEKSVVRWRTTGEHHLIQEKGRGGVLNDYHLRVGDVTKDTNPPAEAPINEQRFDETEVGKTRMVTLTEIVPQKDSELGTPENLYEALGLAALKEQIESYDVFASIYNPGKMAVLVSWLDKTKGSSWVPALPPNAASVRQRSVRIVRDYAKYDRREAPQFYPDAEGRETLHSAPKCPVDHK
jgi:heme-degrading monooxygenase HmoA